MKYLLILITIMLVGGCGKGKETPAKEITDPPKFTPSYDGHEDTANREMGDGLGIKKIPEYEPKEKKED